MEPAPSTPAIEFRDVSYRVADTQVLYGFDLQVQSGETLVLLGRSGSGKTTSLKLVNRLLSPTSGDIRVKGVSNSEADVIRLRRSIGYVIQDVGLFPHFTVERNIGLVPKIEGWADDRIRGRVPSTGAPIAAAFRRVHPKTKKARNEQAQRLALGQTPDGGLIPVLGFARGILSHAGDSLDLRADQRADG